MKFTISTQVLKNITNMLVKIVSNHTPGIPDGILIVIEEKNIIFKTQQFDFNLVYTSEVENTEQGSLYIPINIFDTIVNSLSDSLVTVELQEKEVFIKTNSSESKIFTLENMEDEYLDITSLPEKKAFSVERDILIHGLKSVQHAAAKSFIKPEIASIYIYTESNRVYFVATDTFRLAESSFVSGHILENTQLLVSIKNVQKIVRIFESISDSVVDIYNTEEGIFFTTDSVVVKTNSVYGNFPDYKKIIPNSSDIKITMLKGDMVNFLKKSRFFSNKLLFSIDDTSNLTLSFESDTIGSTKTTVPIVSEGSVISIPPFDCKFIQEALSSIVDEKIVLLLSSDQSKPLLIRGSENLSFTSIISPMVSN